MKSLLIHNFTKRNVHLVDAFLRKHKLYNAHAIVPAEHFTKEIEVLCVRFGLNVLVPLSGLEGGHLSLQEVEKRNPGIEERIANFPRHKIEILRRSSRNMDAENLIGLALNWPELRVRACRSLEQYDAFGEEMHMVFGFMEQNQDEAKTINIHFGEELENDFQMLDFGLLSDLGLVGANECLVMTK
ncbi:hypothetical protein BIZ78_gp110 [Erwinia phage vB_EamM_Caitlin]|uniref:hypothetical protein n=1 Tax=Erwinia phage vB_EamM_Caitlin TaxID=1883379 RepID=UPI00081C6AF5|nr:hypothetical protein BIZ78_gp110 [Erwinia phage vB_EamM_Caitlin]ANZ48465.1 hypothetical protein CAITLIN_170 [Erwinia phage vB_EamM_Caitlin]